VANLIEIIIMGLISLFVIGVCGIALIFGIGQYIHPYMEALANTTFSNSTVANEINISEKYNQTLSALYIIVAITMFTPILLIIIKYFHERESYSY